MPAYPTHTLFSHLALLGLAEAGHPLAPLALKHAGLFRVAGIAGCDIQCMPYQICRNCEAPYRHNQLQNRTCRVCGETALADFFVTTADKRRVSRADIERDLYRNTHLILGRYRGYGVDPKAPKSNNPDQPFPQQVVQHLANLFRDATKIGGKRVENYVAFVLGWFSHVVSDALFKGVYPETARVNFFGHQYNMAMLPAAEAITVTDMAHDFGVHWPTWHDELLKRESDGGALRHLAMGNDPALYDGAYWTEAFGKPDPSIGKVLAALPQVNRKWLHRMYVNPDYSAATPRLDARRMDERAQWRFEGLDLGQLRRYAFGTGWYETFIRGVDVYVRVINEASAGVALPKAEGKIETNGVSWGLWRRIVTEALSGETLGEGWGSTVQVDPRALAFLKEAQDRPVKLSMAERASDYQKELARTLRRVWGVRWTNRSEMCIVIGAPAFNAHSARYLCREDMLRLKYGSGLAGIVKADPDSATLVLAGLSDFGDYKLGQWAQAMR